MRIVCISDTHEPRQISIPDGDVLIHAGDHSYRGQDDEMRDALEWFSSFPHVHKLAIAGNHDWGFQRSGESWREYCLSLGVIYLQDEQTTIGGVEFFGSPWQPVFFDWAFNLPRDGNEIKQKWAAIPSTTNVLITHGPPAGILDQTPSGAGVGCLSLRKRIYELPVLRLHVFGHIHHAHGKEEFAGLTFVNASISDESYKPGNIPIVVDI